MSGLKYFVMLSIFLMLISCSKPVEVMNIDLLFTIDGSFEPETVAEYDKKFTVVSDIEVDKNGNIYLFNPRMERILKFDKDGNYIKYFGNRGTWKGDMMNALDFTILNDTIYIRNNFTPLMIRYSLDGEYIDDYLYTDGKMQMGEILRAVSDSTMVGYLNSMETDSMKVSHTNKLVIMNGKMEEKAVLRSYTAVFDKENPQFFEFMTKYAYGGGKIYVAGNDQDDYRITIFDMSGNKIGEISQDYKAVTYNDLEMKRLENLPVALRKAKDEVDTLKVKPLFKRSVNAIYYDKYGRLTVCPSVKRNEKNQNDFIADIFENDKFLKRVKIPQLKGEDFLHRFDSDIYFIGDRIYEVLHKEMKVNVYGY